MQAVRVWAHSASTSLRFGDPGQELVLETTMRLNANVLMVASLLPAVALADPTPLPHGISVDVGGATVEMEVQGMKAFRLGVGRDGPVDSLYTVEPSSYASYS